MGFPFTNLLFLMAEILSNTILVYYIPSLRHTSPLAITHWVFTGACILFHFIASFKDVILSIFSLDTLRYNQHS